MNFREVYSLQLTVDHTLNNPLPLGKEAKLTKTTYQCHYYNYYLQQLCGHYDGYYRNHCSVGESSDAVVRLNILWTNDSC